MILSHSLPFAVIPASEATASRPGKAKNIGDAVSLVVRVSTRMRTSERFMNTRFQATGDLVLPPCGAALFAAVQER